MFEEKIAANLPAADSGTKLAPSSSNDKSSDELARSIQEKGLVLNQDGYIQWHPRNPKHPRNWTAKRKAYNTAVILLLEFITSAAGTAGTSAAAEAQTDYGVSLGFSIFCLTSTYLIGQGIGGIFFPPYSEVFGRRILYILSTLGYCIFSVLTAAVPSLPVVIIVRLLTGILSAIPTIVVAGSIEDVFNMKARVWMIFTWALIGNIAVCVGPIFSTYVTATIGWRWVFYITSIGLGILFVFCLLLTESRPSLLLEREVASFRKTRPDVTIKTLNPDSAPDAKTLLQVTLLRPLRLLFTEPIVMMVAFMGSVTCALFYLSAESLLLVFEAYGWSPQTASLSFIPIALGCLCGFFTRLYDHRNLANRTKGGKTLEPEDKLFGFSLAAPSLAIGLWVFAWTTPPLTSVHWIVPMLSLVLVGYALNENVYTLTGYLADSYTIYAASGFAGLILARASTCAIILPFTRPMYVNLGYNQATSILAAIATAFCIAPFVFFKYGKRIREVSKFAKYSLTTYQYNQVEDDMNDTKRTTIVIP